MYILCFEALTVVFIFLSEPSGPSAEIRTDKMQVPEDAEGDGMDTKEAGDEVRPPPFRFLQTAVSCSECR